MIKQINESFQRLNEAAFPIMNTVPFSPRRTAEIVASLSRGEATSIWYPSSRYGEIVEAVGAFMGYGKRSDINLPDTYDKNDLIFRSLTDQEIAQLGANVSKDDIFRKIKVRKSNNKIYVILQQGSILIPSTGEWIPTSFITIPIEKIVQIKQGDNKIFTK